MTALERELAEALRNIIPLVEYVGTEYFDATETLNDARAALSRYDAERVATEEQNATVDAPCECETPKARVRQYRDNEAVCDGVCECGGWIEMHEIKVDGKDGGK